MSENVIGNILFENLSFPPLHLDSSDDLGAFRQANPQESALHIANPGDGAMNLFKEMSTAASEVSRILKSRMNHGHSGKKLMSPTVMKAIWRMDRAVEKADEVLSNRNSK